MRVRVLFFGILKDIVGRPEETVEIGSGSTIAGLFQQYAERFATLRDRRSSIVFARNREFSSVDTVLSDNDEVAFLPPVSGGSDHVIRSSAGHLFAISREAIHTRRLVEELQRPEDGAVVVFEGVARNNTKGRATEHLEYECYEEMAIEQMARIGNEIAAQFAIGHLGMVHRLGRLEIGEASVAVVATAPHRKPAFDAALEGINRLKREVPIWKKEFFADGAVWVDGEWDERLLTGSAER
ncbi:MAG TPA: molybdenum cofactor biosynthesis protein MoaE [Bryobacteraceae bacterium]|jgi:molybdopterin synthase catalytic subunit